jgi:hypothetical protein
MKDAAAPHSERERAREPESTAPEPAAPEPAFEVIGMRSVPHAAAPMMMLDLEITDRSGCEIFMIALSVQLMIEPARREYDATTRERLVELFGPPERWAVTTRSLVWAHLDVLVPAFTAATIVPVPLPCSYDLELAAAKYLDALAGDEVPLALHFNGTIYYRGAHGELQMVLVPWTNSIDVRMPISVWRETIEHYYPNTTWVAVRRDTFERLQREKLSRGVATLDECVSHLLERDA